MEGGVTMASAITSGITAVVGIFTDNVVPVLSTAPFNYFLGLSLFGAGCAVFAKVRGII